MAAPMVELRSISKRFVKRLDLAEKIYNFAGGGANPDDVAFIDAALRELLQTEA